MLQVLNLVFQALVNHMELLAFLLPIFGGALLVVFKVITNILIFLLEFCNAFL